MLHMLGVILQFYVFPPRLITPAAPTQSRWPSLFTILSSDPEPSVQEFNKLSSIKIIYTRHSFYTRILTAATATLHTALTERYEMPSKHPSTLTTKPSLMLDKLHLFYVTRHVFILIQNVAFHQCHMFRPEPRPSSGMSIPKSYKGIYNKNLEGS